MPKGGKGYSSASNDGKWYAHDTGFKEACTITGTMLGQVVSSGPQELRVERHLKSKKQDPPDFRFSTHDNREAIRDGICLFSQGLGRKKCPDDHRLHNSHFCLCHDDPVAVSWPSTVGDLTAYQTEGLVRKDQAEAVTNRRFPRSHQERSAEAAAAQAREPAFMWFGRHDSEDSVPLGVLAATNCLATRI
ncbi:testis-expressed protein 36-like isoform X3 [Gadus macrocephalus]|uniref:testis-expressed protein 36-like isoform X3 n=1 Tax=Gadus macrocephalus TaxID=80720 RepID=UPI0028CB815D|nr:testis-expressed protein 36-like isoform X3 [Gadus macrocephalus]